MRTARSNGLLALFALLVVAGCGTPLQVSQQGGRQSTWIAPDAKDLPLLFFEGDVNLGNIYVFSLPDMTLKGTIGGLSMPLGLCSDSAGHVYVVESGKSRVDEFTRTGTQIATYDDTYGYPSGCAVNPKNGDLAVADSGKPYVKVLVYSSPSSAPTILKLPGQTEAAFAGYNGRGELWVDGSNYDDFVLDRCNASSCKTLKVPGAQYFAPGAVQWDDVRKTWVVFDQSCYNVNPGSCSYPVSERGVLGESTEYNNYEHNPVCILPQGVIGGYQKRFVVGGDWEYDTCHDGSNGAYRWGYPQGGNPTNYATLPNDARPYGAAISEK